MARPEIRTLNDLRGKNFGVTNIGGTTWIGAILGLEHFNLNPDRDGIKLQGIGDQTVLLQALLPVEWRPFWSNPPLRVSSRRTALGYWPRLSNAKIQFASSGLVAPQPYLEKHTDVVENVLKALIEATAFLYKPVNRQVVLKILTERLKLSDSISASEALQDFASWWQKSLIPM